MDHAVIATRRREPKVSVVVPVYNAMPYLRELLDSLAAQDLGSGSFNVIAVDDGSTDGSAELLEAYRRIHTNLEVIHQEHSGWPGRPRNVGIRASTTPYLFFADADDVVAPEALRRLVDFAEQHNSDIVIPKLTPLGGRRFPTSVYEKTLIDADLLTAFGTLFSPKLHRRRMLVDHGISFPEGKVYVEDGIFNAHAYMHATRVSIVADYDYYYVRAREDGRNISRRKREPVAYTSSVAHISRIVREHLGDSATADQIVLDLYCRKCLEVYHPRRFAKCDEAVQDVWMAQHKVFVDEFVSEAMEQQLESPFRERSYFVRRADKAGLLALKAKRAAPKSAARAVPPAGNIMRRIARRLTRRPKPARYL